MSTSSMIRRMHPLVMYSPARVRIAGSADTWRRSPPAATPAPSHHGEMHKIDTDGDGTVSKAEWLAYQERCGARSTRTSKERSTIKIPCSVARDGDLRDRRLRARPPDQVNDAQDRHDNDGTVSHDEYIAYQTKLFDMMDKNHAGSLGPQEFLGK